MKKGIWKQQIIDANNIRAVIPFCFTRGDSFFSLRKEILYKSYQMVPESLLRIVAGIRNTSKQDLELQAYFDPTSASDPETGRAYLLMVQSKVFSFKSILSTTAFLVTNCKDKIEESPHHKRSAAKKKLASNLHSYMHFHPAHVVLMWKGAGILSTILKAEFKRPYDILTSCKKTGRPLNLRNISFNQMLIDFNGMVQMDFFFVSELTKNSILQRLMHPWRERHGCINCFFCNTNHTFHRNDCCKGRIRAHMDQP